MIGWVVKSVVFWVCAAVAVCVPGWGACWRWKDGGGGVFSSAEGVASVCAVRMGTFGVRKYLIGAGVCLRRRRARDRGMEDMFVVGRELCFDAECVVYFNWTICTV
jgi:hypothetical protein